MDHTSRKVSQNRQTTIMQRKAILFLQCCCMIIHTRQPQKCIQSCFITAQINRTLKQHLKKKKETDFFSDVFSFFLFWFLCKIIKLLIRYWKENTTLKHIRYVSVEMFVLRLVILVLIYWSVLCFFCCCYLENHWHHWVTLHENFHQSQMYVIKVRFNG